MDHRRTRAPARPRTPRTLRTLLARAVATGAAATLAVGLAAGLGSGLALAVPAEAGAPAVDLQPQRLPRGAGVAVAHVEDGVLVDGDRRTELPGTDARLLGASHGGWALATWRTNRVGETRGGRVVHVASSGSVRTVIRTADPHGVVLSEDGVVVFTVEDPRHRAATAKVWSMLDGGQAAAHRFRGLPDVLTGADGKAVVRTTRGTYRWKWSKGNVRVLTRRMTGTASIEHDLLTTFTKDPYLGGCTRLVRVSRPQVTVWRSCRDRLAAFSPDGTQMLTFGILTDGVGPGELHLRRTGGKRLATWTTGWFDGWEWESPDTLLLDTHGTRRSATVRCTLADCENATDPVRTTSP